MSRRGSVQVQFPNMWREHLSIALAAKMVRDEILQFLADDRPTWRPEDEPLAHFFIDVEQLKVLSEFAVISLFGFFKAGQGGFQRFL